VSLLELEDVNAYYGESHILRGLSSCGTCR